MISITAGTLRSKLKEYLDKVVNSSETLIIPREGDEAVVVISLREYNALIETNYLMSSNQNRERLNNAINQHKEGKAKTQDFKLD